MTPYSAAADGSFSSRPSSRFAALSAVLGQLLRLDLLAQLVHLGLVVVALAELVLDRLQLLAEEVLALALLDLRGDLRLDLRAELGDVELAREDDRDRAQPLEHVHGLEQRLALVRLQAERRGDQVAERARVVDVRRRELQLLGQVRRHPDDPAELGLDVPRQRLDVGRVGDDVGELLELADEVRLVPDRLAEADPLQPLDEDPQRAVGHLDHLVDDRGGADLVEVVRSRAARGPRPRSADGQEREHPVARDDVVDQLDRPLLADRERRHRLGEDDGLLQRQDREPRGGLERRLLGGELRRLEARSSDPAARRSRPAGPRRRRSTIGSVIVSSPRS